MSTFQQKRTTEFSFGLNIISLGHNFTSSFKYVEVGSFSAVYIILRVKHEGGEGDVVFLDKTSDFFMYVPQYIL